MPILIFAKINTLIIWSKWSVLKIYLKQSPEKYNIYSDNRFVFKFLKMILIDNGALSQTNKILIQSPRMNQWYILCM